MDKRWVILFCASTSLTWVAGAQSREENWARCESDLDPKIRIAACTALIRSGQETANDLAGDYSSRAFIYMMKGDYDRAIQDYDQLLRIEPGSAQALDGRGYCYFAKRQYDRAIQDYDQAITLNPKSHLLFESRGRAYLKKRDYDRAVQDLDLAIRINPRFADAFYERGLAKRKRGDKIGGAADIAMARQLNPEVGK